MRRHRLAIRRILIRLVSSIAVIFGVVTATFLLSRVVSPDPTSLYVAPDADAETRAIVRERLGLDTSIASQYVTFLGDLLRGDLGTSFSTGQPVTEDLIRKLPATLELAVYAMVLGTLVGISAGVVAAVRRGRVIDKVVRFCTIGGLSLPHFWVGLVLIWIFFVVLGVMPGPVGRLPIGIAPPPHVTGFYVVDALLSGRLDTAVAAARQLVLPVFTLALGVFAPIARTVRSTMLSVLGSDYVRTAFAMGIHPRVIYSGYALRNVLLPVLTMLAGAVAFTFSGSVLVEGVFAWPGMGQYALQAVQQPDFPATQGFVLYAAVIYVVIYLVVDLAYMRADPRVRI